MAAVKQRKSGGAPSSLDSFPFPSPPKTTSPRSRSTNERVDEEGESTPTRIAQTGESLSAADLQQDGLSISIPINVQARTRTQSIQSHTSAPTRSSFSEKSYRHKQQKDIHSRQQSTKGPTSKLPAKGSRFLILQRRHPVATRLVYPANYNSRSTVIKQGKNSFNGAAIGVIYEEQAPVKRAEGDHLSRKSVASSISTDLHSDTGAGIAHEEYRSSEESTDVMDALEKRTGPTDGVQEPGKVHIPKSKYNTRSRDLEANHPTGHQHISGQHHGASRRPLDLPTNPPRHVPLASNGPQSPISARNEPTSLPPAPNNNLTQNGDGANDDTNTSEDMSWGPSHPCFPHMNPHVPLNSTEYISTRIIRIKRDWMVVGDLAPTFSNIYPEILDPLLQEQEFRRIIRHVNTALCQAFDPFSGWNWIDGLLGLVTGWLWEDFRPSGVKGQLRELERWIEQWNLDNSRDGVKIIPLRRTGYTNLDIQIPDPQVKVISTKEGSQQEDGQEPGNETRDMRGGRNADGDFRRSPSLGHGRDVSDDASR